MFIAAADHVYYLGHFEFRAVPDGPLVDDVRDAIAAANYDEQFSSPISVSQGMQVGQLEEYWLEVDPDGSYASGDEYTYDWAHLHISVFDPAHGYDNLNPLFYLPKEAKGSSTAMMSVADDERPFVGDVELQADPSDSGASIIDTDVDPLPGESNLRECGVHVSGKFDVLAHMTDTYSTHRPRPNTFVGQTSYNDTIGIYGARYIAKHLGSDYSVSGTWYESPLGCDGYECGAWRIPFAESAFTNGSYSYGDRPANYDGSSHTPFLSYLQHTAPYFVGWDFSDRLFDVARSAKDHYPDDAVFEYVHSLTNGIGEGSDSSSGGYWDTDAGPEGTYSLTVEAWDAAGNVGYNSRTVQVSRGGIASGTSADWGPVIGKDHESDYGQIPSTPDGEVFWQSQDVIVIPERAAGDPEPAPGVAPSASAVAANQTYEVWIRVHNTGCVRTEGVQAKVWSADPSTGFADPQLLGTTSTKSIDGGETLLVGPVLWNVTAEDLDDLDEGHRCLLAKIGSDDAPLSGSDNPETFDTARDPTVIQRNVQARNLYFAIKNTRPTWEDSQLVIDASDLPDGARFQLHIEKTPELEDAWGVDCSAMSSSSAVSCFEYGDIYVLEILAGQGESPTWPMPPVSQHATVTGYDMPDGTSGTVVVSHKLGGSTLGGMTFHLVGASIVR